MLNIGLNTLFNLRLFFIYTTVVVPKLDIIDAYYIITGLKLNYNSQVGCQFSNSLKVHAQR